jgi:hypothetical protein
LYYQPAYGLNGSRLPQLPQEVSMPLHEQAVGTALLLIVLASAACDFRQITEDRPVKLPAESTEPKEVHSSETKGFDRTTPTTKQ